MSFDWPGLDDFQEEQLPENVQDRFHSMIDQARNCLDTDDEEISSDNLRELMRACDEFLQSLSETPLASNGDVLSNLDNQLWEWFQSPPSPETFENEFTRILERLNEKVKDSPEESENPDEQAEGGSEESTREDERDDQTEETASRNTSGTVSASDSGDSSQLTIELDVDSGMLEDFLSEAEGEINTLETMMVDVEENPSDDVLNRLYRAMHTLKGGFGFCNLEVCSELTHEAETLLDVLREDPPQQVPTTWIELLLASVDITRTILARLQKAVDEETSEITVDVPHSYVRKVIEDLDRAVNGKTDRDAFESFEADSGDAETDLESNIVKVDLDDVGELVDLVGELVISNSELKEVVDKSDREVQQTFNKQEKILNQLQQKSMNMRMLPLKREFKKYPRIVRDLAADTGKEVNLTIKGEGTQLDKSVLDNLEGPLLHLVRNAVDHGLEPPEERIDNGKPEEGQLSIRAYHESGHVYIEIEEDGRGLPTDDIEQKAIERGLIEKDHDLSPDEIHRLILEPGFSTTEEVTNVSGRGVGMDVVATQIEDLRGNLLIDSTPGEGTKFTLELPLTVAIIDGLITRIGEEQFIFPVNQVEESINPGPEDIQWMQGRGRVVQFRDNVVPVINPTEMIEHVDRDDELHDRTIMVIVSTKDERFAIWVDELVAHEQIVIKQIENPEIERSDLTAGGAILGDGSVGLILDIMGLIRRFQEQTSTGTTNQSETFREEHEDHATK
jgi:two-component system chemotaxis sensor kinase CheA